ncbi:MULTISPECIES: LacI family DNA-binding transcriptional regulator [unclassified Chelatococcus]|uniref:LacI family DNA-binding transcriptional regulator n=1 Tax=unclassified Chelatococcus TaxID=2638111 RepID=UPI0002F00D3E|nr:MULTISPECIES: LacI family DNA-binding transcriptional regulator [unclassified Chelatococcus]ALA18335.1 LacI family transcriptional regulator [Chelatococcus sp. CO-6]
MTIRHETAPMPAAPLRLAEVAARAGVSESTVSRVLRNIGPIAEATRVAVLKAAEELGYVPNRLAGALASTGSALVGVVVPSLDNIVFAEVLRGVTERLEEAGLQAVIGVTGYDLAREERIVSALLAWRPRGIVIAGIDHTPRLRDLLAANGTAVVEMMDIDGAEPALDRRVGLSHGAAGAAMAAHLIARGHRRFGYVGHDISRDIRARKRLDGFAAELARRGAALVAEEMVAGPSSVTAGRAGLAALLAAHRDLDAVYFSNDDMAVGGYFHCEANGIRMPDDLAIAGFNGLDIGQELPRRLTTVRSPRYRIGQLAAEQVLTRQDAAEDMAKPATIDVGFELIAGETA